MIDRDEHARLMRAFYARRRADPLDNCSGEDRCILPIHHDGPHLPRPHYPVSRLAATGTAPTLSRIRCDRCRAELHHAGYCAPGGIVVVLTTCPICDRKDDDE